jgi:hypothetical protein
MRSSATAELPLLLPVAETTADGECWGINFEVVRVVRANETKLVRSVVDPDFPLPVAMTDERICPERIFMRSVIRQTLIASRGRGEDTKLKHPIGNLALTYMNARGRSFDQYFVLTVRDERFVSCELKMSLIDAAK